MSRASRSICCPCHALGAIQAKLAAPFCRHEYREEPSLSSCEWNLRRMVKRLLKKYKYPPEEQEKALETVIKQCELYADSDEFDSPIQSFVKSEIDNTDYSLAAEA